jgi:hypothetical protein
MSYGTWTWRNGRRNSAFQRNEPLRTPASQPGLFHQLRESADSWDMFLNKAETLPCASQSKIMVFKRL